MKNLTLIIAIAVNSLSLYAQPQIENASNLPEPGYSFSFGIAMNANPGQPGANQVWDFSAFEYSELAEGLIIDPTDSPLFDSYPSTDFAYSLISDFEAYTHLNVTSDKMEVITYFVTSPGSGNDYSPNPRTMLKFPFAYQEQVMDTWQKPGESENTVMLEYDGYGTLITPLGTYNNVARIRENYGQGEDDYQWYTLDPLMQVAVFDHNDNEMYFFGADITSIDETNTNIAVEVFPNPATDFVNVTISGTAFSEEAEFVLMNTKGQQIRNLRLADASAQIDLKDLSVGVYFYHVIVENMSVEIGKIVVQ